MKIADSIAQMKALRKDLKGSVGFVPTMGFLHEGHLSLVKEARRNNDNVIVSIFVNPTQFGPSEDFSTYPRDTERDLTMLKKENTDIVFIPSPEDMYPQGCNTWVNVEDITVPLEGSHRPGHFKGVTTIVSKLFNIVEPSRAYFGQKDAQQALVIKKMVKDLDFNLEIVVLPTTRESDGLAMSSRNIYLNDDERMAATVLSRALASAQQRFRNGERNAEYLRQMIKAEIEKEPLANIDYVSIADQNTLQELSTIEGPALASLAVRIGKTRLIDNIVLG